MIAQTIGALLLALPLAGFATVMARDLGWRAAACCWAATLAITAIVVAGALLLTA